MTDFDGARELDRFTTSITVWVSSRKLSEVISNRTMPVVVSKRESLREAHQQTEFQHWLLGGKIAAVGNGL
jgi:hypothetical protein